MAKATVVRWLDEPADKDYAAAESFLSMLVAPAPLVDLLEALRSAPHGRWAAKDILRAAGLPLLKAKQSTEVADKLKRVKSGERISPILLIGGLREYLVVADGYHRASAACLLDEDTMVPGRLLWLT